MRKDNRGFRGGRGRGGSGRNGSRRGGGGNRYGGGGGGRRGGGRHGRGQQDSGNQRERIAVESGHLVLIDQFMFANPQFTSRLAEIVDEDPEMKNDLIRDYGGTVVKIEPGTYRIERDPYALSIVVHPDGFKPNTKSIADRATRTEGHVFVDTRCLAMVDRELLDDTVLLDKYQQLWYSGQDKACRDLLRDNGGAVRYGFGRFGDELGVYLVPEEDVICLWPDVAEPEAVQPEA